MIRSEISRIDHRTYCLTNVYTIYFSLFFFDRIIFTRLRVFKAIIMYALLRPTGDSTGTEGKDFMRRIGKPRYIFRYHRGHSAGTRSPTQLFRYAGVSRTYEEGRADRAAAGTRETASYRHRGQEGDNRPTVRWIQASVRAILARGRPVLGMGSYSEAAGGCGE